MERSILMLSAIAQSTVQMMSNWGNWCKWLVKMLHICQSRILETRVTFQAFHQFSALSTNGSQNYNAGRSKQLTHNWCQFSQPSRLDIGELDCKLGLEDVYWPYLEWIIKCVDICKIFFKRSSVCHLCLCTRLVVHSCKWMTCIIY